MSPDEFDAWQQREQAHQRRDDVIHAAAIRAALYAARNLPPATGCAALPCEHCSPPTHDCVCTEVGACASGGCCGACRCGEGKGGAP